MMYLVLSPEFSAKPLRTEFDLPSNEWPLDISKSIEDRILIWNERYLDVIVGGSQAAAALVAKRELDLEGIQIAKLIMERYEVKVKYFGT